MKEQAKLPPTFPGHRYWKAVQGSVDAILAPMGIRRRVVSRGHQFCNVDAWTWLHLTEHLCDHFSRNPDRVPDRVELKEILRKTNSARCRDPHIRVAKMPERVTQRVALAIVGGGYHEAWHTKYSKRDRVRLSEAQEVVDLLDDVIKNGGRWDQKMRGLLTTLQHLVEDVRIERRGNEEFPGALQPMRDLQDFILDLEAKGRSQGATVKNIPVSSNARSILLCAFRDLGLGYNTQKAREALEFYKEAAPEAVEMLKPGGILAPLLHEAIHLRADDKTGSLRVAAKIVGVLWKATQTDSQEDAPKTACPNCGAGPKDLIVRSVKDDRGRKIPGVAEMECKVCGFKHQFQLPDESLNFDQRDREEDGEHPEVEDLYQEDVDGSDGFGYDDREKMRDVARSLEKQKGPDSDDSEEGPEQAPGASREDEKQEEFEDLDPLSGSREEDSEGEGAEGEGAEGEGAEGEASEGEGAEGEASEGEASEGEASEGEASEGEAKTRENIPNPFGDVEGWEMSAQELLERMGDGASAGGLNFDLGRSPDSFLHQIEKVLDGSEKDGVLGGIEALEQAVSEASAAEVRTLERGEQLWNPYDPMLDEASMVVSSHRDSDLARANVMLSEVRSTVAFLRSRLRMIVRAQEMTDTTHGVRRGRKMSSRMLVDTAVDLRSGRVPSRPYQVTDAQPDTSFALALCLDQSGSMWPRVRQVAQCMMVMTDAVEGIGGATLAFGFRDGNNGGGVPAYHRHEYHRVTGVRYDVFKTWDEKFATSKWRFAHTQAAGTTPMADGVQFGLAALNERREGHRVLAVITDGIPNSPHERVIARQVRLAKEAGIHVLGIGIGREAQYVGQLFPDHVWAERVEDLPRPLLKKLNELCDFQGRYRGRKARLDGRVTQRVV